MRRPRLTVCRNTVPAGRRSVNDVANGGVLRAFCCLLFLCKHLQVTYNETVNVGGVNNFLPEVDIVSVRARREGHRLRSGPVTGVKVRVSVSALRCVEGEIDRDIVTSWSGWAPNATVYAPV